MRPSIPRAPSAAPWPTGMAGRVFGYRPGQTGGGLYAVRFEGGTTLLSTKRVRKAGGAR